MIEWRFWRRAERTADQLFARGRLAMVAKDGSMQRMNAGWRTLIGPSLDTALAPDSAVLLRHALSDCLAGRTPSALPDLMLAAGGEIRIEIVALPNGGVLLSAEDRSDIALLRQQLSHSQRLQAVGAFTGAIGHDFNNLLGVVIGAVDTIEERTDLAPDLRADIAIIRGGAERGTGLVRQLLAFGGQQTLQPRGLDVNKALVGIGEMLRRLLPSSVQLDLLLEDPGRHVLIDPTQFDQIIMNLAVNARDAMPDGGRLALISGHATLLAARPALPDTIPPGRYVTIAVQDSGHGIPPDLLAQVFAPFFSTRRGRGGSGLGLATVLGIVHQSNGFLSVESVLGKGSNFILYFARHEGPMPVAAAVAAAKLPARGGVVLLVEDEDALRGLTARQLVKRGWTVHAAADAEDALRLMAGLPHIDVVVTDLVMPGMDGGALVRALRASIGRPDLPAIMVSGYADADQRALVGTRATAFLPKPYRVAELVDCLVEILPPGDKQG